MADIAARKPVRTADARTWAAVLGVLAASAIVLRLSNPERVAWIQAFFVLFGSLLIQALPFVLIGALAAALIEVFVPMGTLDKLAKLPRPLQLPAAGLAGVALPICECGSVPVARRLIQKGLMPSAGITFMLAAPVVNPVVIASTFFAFRGRSSLWTMVIGRFTLGLLVAVAAGWVIGARSKDDLLRPRADDEHHASHLLELGPPESRWKLFFAHLGNDFLYMARFLVLGATIAAFVQTFLPAPIIDRVAGTPVLDIAVMMALGFVLSLCSASDAFIAVSFVQFGAAAQLAFLVFGPMVDFKLSAIYISAFRRGFLRTLVITVAATTLAAAMWVKVIAG